MESEEYDPEATVWRAVADLERKHFTREEIARSLVDVSTDVARDA